MTGETDPDDVARARQEMITRVKDFIDQNTRYNTLLMGAGYAAFLTLWSGFRPHLPPWAVLLSGSLVGVSLVFFVAWELIKSIITQAAILKVGKIITTHSEHPDLIEMWRSAFRKSDLTMMSANRFWPWFYWPSVLGGIAGALILIIVSGVVGTAKLLG